MAAGPAGAETPVTVAPGTGIVTVSGTGPFTMPVTASLNQASTDPVTVDWATRFVPDGPTNPFLGPQAPTSDYVAASGTLTFPPGTTSATFDLAVLTDSTPGPDEYIVITFTNPTNAIVASPGFGFGIIAHAI